MDLIKSIEAEQIKENAENFNIGDTVKVYFKLLKGQQKGFRFLKEPALLKIIQD